ncbi:low temperature requirement protein A [Micromonospora sp. NPDC047074]|uniref:low temperature requirement protein A n=1 Tax=Micromonospora sp. NPDC047074 TaxID=3154339 RepID=UPI0033EC42AB
MTTSRALRPWYRPMVARRPGEEHRAATPLELFFDLCIVVAVAQTAAGLHDDIVAGHVDDAVASYLRVFFAIWWAWMNVTWFSSAYDTDDDVYRITALVEIAGALVLAAGVPRAFADDDFTTTTYGYVLIRLAAVAQWLRAAAGDPTHRRADHRYALGVALVQAGWLLRLLLPADWLLTAFVLLALADLLVPVLAERPGTTPWNPGHIAERYGLFTLIVLGEVVLATSVAIEAGVDAGEQGLWRLGAAGTVIVFALWWLYFDRPVEVPRRLRGTLTWGYGHYLIFASVAATGAGLWVAIAHERDSAHVGGVVVGYATAIPVAVYLLTVWVLHVRPRHLGATAVAFPATAALVLLAPLGPTPVYVVAGLLFALVVVTVVQRQREIRAGAPTTAPP